MREVRGVKYEIIKESDIDQSLIYAFYDKEDNNIAFLCRKDNQFFWKQMNSTNRVWHKNYDTVEEAIDGVLLLDDYNKRNNGSIMEFRTTKEFLNWALSQLK